MRESDIRERAFAMPLTSPAYSPGPYRFINREYLIITYRTDPEKLRALVPEPLVSDGDIVKYEFIRMPDSTGFGDYTETGQVIPVTFRGRQGGYSHCMFLNDEGPIAGGRELWGFPKKLADPTLHIEVDTLVGTSTTARCASPPDQRVRNGVIVHTATLSSSRNWTSTSGAASTSQCSASASKPAAVVAPTDLTLPAIPVFSFNSRSSLSQSCRSSE
jgi:Acetoacetate decarboxylase (ADC)